MASIRKQIPLAASADAVWDALRDLGGLHTRLVPGFVTDCRLDDDHGTQSRTVTFANGMVAKELIVDVDEATRRVAWSVVGGRFTHHNASAQVFADGQERSCVVWTADFLPHEIREPIAAMIEQGAAAMQKAFERR